ncbi:MAG: MBL fold metallo-hydrolase, partial [Elusimicrobiota bacterium]
LALIEEYGKKPIKGHIFVGHTHWDHIQGFPFFTPLYSPQNHFSVYSVRGAGKSLERVFRGQMAADYFPVPLKSLSSQLQFIELEEAVKIGEAKVSYYFLNHPGVSIGFRFDYRGKRISYLSDHETFSRLGGASEHNKRQDDGVAEFAKDSDILICEAQYDEKEYESKKGWGHSTFNDVVDRALQAEAKHLILFHHDPEHTDEIMDAYVAECNERIRSAGSLMRCTGAQEKETITL